MHVIQEQAAFARQKGLFKSGTAWQVLLSITCLVDSASQGLFSTNAFSTNAPPLDMFISHSWSCPRWKKILSMCHHFNLDLAIILCLSTCFAGASILALLAGSISGVAREYQGWLAATLMYLPMAIFFLTYFFGHVFCRKTLWFDGVCVNQADVFEKAAILRAIPAFVANSSEMLVLWDDAYFQRLWCVFDAWPLSTLVFHIPLKTSHGLATKSLIDNYYVGFFAWGQF